MPGREPARVVEVDGAGGGRVDEAFEDGGDLVRALRVAGEGGEFGGGDGDGAAGLGEGAVGLAAQGPAFGTVAGLAEDVHEVGVRGGARCREPGAYAAAALPGMGRCPTISTIAQASSVSRSG